MSRVLLAWELGLNLGHLARLLPLAERLKSEGHQVLVATRDIEAATRVLVPARIPFIQAPHLPKGIALSHRPSGYPDVLLSQGWIDRAALHGLTHAWLNLFRLFNPARLILDYSPTVSLAARIANIPATLVGNGFELPPTVDPLPPFPDFSWATAARAAKSEGLALSNANGVLAAYGAAPMTALRDLFLRDTRLLATFPELDHYGGRSNERYIGPLLGSLRAPRVEWPAGDGPRIFATLRPDTNHVQAILGALGSLEARVICVANGFDATQLAPFGKAHIRFQGSPVDLLSLHDADLCVTYGGEGTMLRFLMMGVPQLVSPWHVETFMAARRIAAAGLGNWLDGKPTAEDVAGMIGTMAADAALSSRAKGFAQRSVPLELDQLISTVMGESVAEVVT